MSTDDSSPPPDDAERDEAQATLRRRLDYLFRRCDTESDGAAQALFKAVLEYRLESPR